MKRTKPLPTITGACPGAAAPLELVVVSGAAEATSASSDDRWADASASSTGSRTNATSMRSLLPPVPLGGVVPTSVGEELMGGEPLGGDPEEAVPLGGGGLEAEPPPELEPLLLGRLPELASDPVLIAFMRLPIPAII